MKLHTHKLVKKYKSRRVVDEVSVSVEQGEIVGLAWDPMGQEKPPPST